MKGLILAAGRGSRMGALTEDAPKCLVPLAGRTLLEWQLHALRGAGIADVGVVRGYKAHLLGSYQLTTFENPRWPETNMVASLACAAAWLREAPVIVSYADIFYPVSAVAALKAASGDIVITYDREWLDLWTARFANPLSDAETFKLDGTTVTEIGQRAGSLDDIRGQYMGLLKFTPQGWKTVEQYRDSLDAARRDRLDMTSLLSGLISQGEPVQAVAVPGPWGEVDNASDLALYERWIEEGRLVMPD